MNLKLALSLVALCLALVGCVEQSYFDKYKGFQVYKLTPRKETDLDLLNDLRTKYSNNIQFWKEPRGLNNWLNIMVNNLVKDDFEMNLKQAKIDFSISINDVGDLIEKQFKLKLIKEEKINNNGNYTFDYNKYHTLDDINQWMINIQKAYPQLVTIINITRSYEQRDIFAIKISVPNERPNKKALWFDGGIHAREWLIKCFIFINFYFIFF